MTNNTITARIARYIALPVVSAGIIGGAALGLAGTATAATQIESNDHGNKFAPSVKAQPAPGVDPGWHNNHGVWRIEKLQPNFRR
ncbi:MAG TPA: hypothetical protein VHU62_06750 [Mycobacterium sp.]|jgi:hypothetical protein|nr:hypothetical protein [Mycobacterium sp.]